MKTLHELITEQIENLSTSELIELNNTYCRENNIEDEVYDNDEEFFNMFFEGKVMDAVRAVAYGEFNYTDDYVKFNGYGNLESFNRLETKDLCEYPSNIAAHAIDNQDEYPMLDFDVEFEEEEN